MKNENIIHCSSLDNMIACIARLVREGITFEADAENWRITLTGGY